MIDTAGTLTQAANAIMDKGATRVFAYATHAVLSGPAVERITKSPIEEVVVTDSIPLSPAAAGLAGRSGPSRWPGSSPRRSGASTRPTRSRACSSDPGRPGLPIRPPSGRSP